jgi:hypothetical protein
MSDIIDLSNIPLEEFLVQDGAPEGWVLDAEGFAISNDDEALWAVRRLAQAQRRVDEVKRQAQVEVDRIQRWVEANLGTHNGTIRYLEGVLTNYLVRVRENTADGRKSLTFPDGVVTSRVASSKVEVTDLDAFLAWAEANGHEDWVRVKREANLSLIKKGVDFEADAVLDPLSGSPIEGLAHIAGGLSVSVKVAE